MIRLFHIVLGCVLAIMYFYILMNLDKFFPGVVEADKAANSGESGWAVSQKASGGLYYVFIAPIFTIVCFLFPDVLANRYSPKSGLFGKPILTEGFWYIVGYFMIFVSYGLFKLFE